MIKDRYGHVQQTAYHGEDACDSKAVDQRPTITALISRLGVALNCAEDESRSMTNAIVHGYGPSPAVNTRPELVEAEPDNLLARLEAYVERAEGLHKAMAYLREHI